MTTPMNDLDNDQIVKAFDVLMNFSHSNVVFCQDQKNLVIFIDVVKYK